MSDQIEFKGGDVVRIFKQPEDQRVHLQGKVGVVDEAGGSMVHFIELKLDDGCGGRGNVPMSCLETVTDPRWIKARDDRNRKMDERIAAMNEEQKKREQATETARKIVGKAFGIDDARVEHIVSAYNKTLAEELDNAGLHERY